ncbi:MAG: histidine phosphatase family protein [Planctomycetota bacterium]|nr:MAG: histidine phosphatase family protein [Planctomycetota bacterium]REK27310.1 MAG: histidine phosphatase family protein [Planctomycetota bacterium]REK36669.1 MAG: histidine phosphatase family protein [Planctomycetota bacterium]
MKTLLVMRHAKSSWDNPDLLDHQRPLKKRGLRDAPRMGRWLVEHELMPDLIVSSPAVRARTTAELVAEACHCDEAIRIVDDLYPGSPRDWIAAAAAIREGVNRLLMVGHNPGIEDFLETLTGEFVRMPTAAIARLDVTIDDWSTFNVDGNVTLVDAYRPKEIDAE